MVWQKSIVLNFHSRSMNAVYVTVFAIALCLGSSNLLAAPQDKPVIVTLEIHPEKRGTLTSVQEWMQKLQKVGANRVTTALGGAASASVKENETDRAISIRVTGFLERGKLVLPGGKFTIREMGKIKNLISGFRKDGAEVTLSEKKAFGLTAKQLVWLHSQLNVKVKNPTKDRKLSDIIAELRKPLEQESQVPLVIDSSARRIIDTAKATEELQGLSTGTTLAAILRPHGMVLEPVHVKANQIELHIKTTQQSEEHWPVGWPLQDSPVRVEPKMFQKMPIKIKNFPLDKVMAAVQKRADVHFLYDQNSLARKGIEMNKIKVDLDERNAALAVVVSRLLGQTKPRMSSEMRMDENGKGFLWLSAR